MRLGHIVRWAVGILLLPLCYASVAAFVQEVGKGMVGGGSSLVLASFALGFVVYVVIFLFFHKSIAGAFFGQKSVQRMWSTVTGYRLQDLPQTGGPSREAPKDSKGREVPLWAIMLPHMVPITTIVAMLIVWGIRYVFEYDLDWYFRTQAFVVGLTYAFHLFLLGVHIRERHAGLRAAGYLFTLVIVFLVHLQILAVLAWIVTPEGGPIWVDFNIALLKEANWVYFYVWRWIQETSDNAG